MRIRDHVLVGLGYDWSGRPELDWAAREAAARNLPLEVVRAYDISEATAPWVALPDPGILLELRDVADQGLDAARFYVAQQWPDLPVRTRAVEGRAAEALIDASGDAALTVVGGRQLNALGAAILGSVSQAVASAGHGPVVVVGRFAQEPSGQAAVVVGIDGSAGSDDVLAFAFEHADRHHRPLRAITCWQHDVAEISPWPGAHFGREAATRALDEALATWRDKHPDVPVHGEVVHDQPVPALVNSSAGQDLLVVGSNARHRRMDALLGSVSHGVLHHARCPVAIVHPDGAPR